MACERVRVRVCACWGRAAWCARGRRATWLMVLLVVPLVFRVPSGPAAREIATREPTARSGRSRSPPVPSGPSGTLHTGGACVAVTSPARPRRRPRAPQPGTATLWSCRHPPHRRRLCRCVWLGASPRSPARPCRRPRAPPPTGSTAWPSRSCGALHTGRANPLRVAVRSRFEVVSCPKCRPPRRKTLKTGCYGRSGLRFGHVGTCHSALLAREPAIASGNPLCRT